MFLNDVLYKSGWKREGCSRKRTHLSFLFFLLGRSIPIPSKGGTSQLYSYSFPSGPSSTCFHKHDRIVKILSNGCCRVPSLQKCFSSSLSIRLTRINLLSADKASNLLLLSYFRDASTLQPCVVLYVIWTLTSFSLSHWFIEWMTLCLLYLIRGSNNYSKLIIRNLHIMSVRNKSHIYSLVFNLSKVSRGPMVWDMSIYPF